MRLAYLAICIAELFCSAVWAQDRDMAGAAEANRAAMSTVLSSGKAKEVLPQYTATPGELRYNGTDLRSQAQSRLVACAANSALPGCDAVLAVQQTATHPRADLSGVAGSVNAAHSIAANPAGTLGNLTSMYSGCSEAGTCSSDAFCLGPSCFDTSSVNDPDFAQAMTYMEAAREAGVYIDPSRGRDVNTLRVFGGEDNRCGENLIQNCCAARAEGKGMSNGGMTGVGSKLVYDLLMNSANQRFLIAGMKSLATNAGFSGTISSYGVSFTANPMIVDPYYTELAATDGWAVAIDPTTMAISVIVLVAMQMMSCDPEELKTALKEGAGLCHMVDERHCKKRVLGICLKRESVKCCFNSVLARVINEQGRAQLGIGWGSGDKPSCDGFSVAQLQSLDFSRMDLSEFYASIVPNTPDVAGMQTAAQARVPSCYYGNGKCYDTPAPPPPRGSVGSAVPVP